MNVALGFTLAQPISAALAALIEAERAFARACLEKDIRASFPEFLADDGTALQPQPANDKETLREQPVSLNPDAVIHPNEGTSFADVAHSGDIGYTCGSHEMK